MKPKTSGKLIVFFVVCFILCALLIALIGLFRREQWIVLYLVAFGVMLLLIVGILWTYSLVKRIHPCVKKYSVTSLNPAEIKKKADAEEPFSIRIGERVIEMTVKPDPLLDEDCEIIEIKDEKEIRGKLKDVFTYTGKVAGFEEGGDVRLTISEDFLSGYILVDDDWWFIEPLKKFRMDADVTDFIVYRTKDLKFKMNVDGDVQQQKVETVDPNKLPEGSGYIEAPPSGSPAPGPHKVGPEIGLVAVADCEYHKQAKWTGAEWYVHQCAVIHTVNGIYCSQIGCFFKIKAWILAYKQLDSSDASKLLDQLGSLVKNKWGDLRLVNVRQAKKTEVAHLTSGKNLDGNKLGMAWRPGVSGLSQQQLIWIGGGGGLWGGPPNLTFQNMMLAAHELGHNFEGRHSHAVKWCAKKMWFFGWHCVDYVRSIMWPSFYDDNLKIFSRGKKDPNHNNNKRMKNNMANERHVNYQNM